MNKRLIGSIVLAVFLAACSNKPVKVEPKPAVEDKSPGQTEVKPVEKAPVAQAPAVTTPAPRETTMVNPLKDPANILSKRSIYFDYDKDDVKPEYRPLIEAHAKYLNAHSEARIALQGNTDERGSPEYNLSLGQRRAVAVKKVLNLLGINDRQIETVSYGEEKPKAAGHDDASWSQNRRADIIYQGEE